MTGADSSTLQQRHLAALHDTGWFQAAVRIARCGSAPDSGIMAARCPAHRKHQEEFEAGPAQPILSFGKSHEHSRVCLSLASSLSLLLCGLTLLGPRLSTRPSARPPRQIGRKSAALAKECSLGPRAA